MDDDERRLALRNMEPGAAIAAVERERADVSTITDDAERVARLADIDAELARLRALAGTGLRHEPPRGRRQPPRETT